MLFQEIGLQWGDPDPPLTSRSYCGPSCLDEKRGSQRSHAGAQEDRKSQGSGQEPPSVPRALQPDTWWESDSLSPRQKYHL